jgi:hypothetical protein
LDGWLDFSWAEAWSLNGIMEQTKQSIPWCFEFQFEQIGIGDINNDGANYFWLK